MERQRSKKWFLRAGDFRPEEVTLDNMKLTFGRHTSLDQAIEWLSQGNNVFPSKQIAEEASLTVRSFLASFAIVRSEPARLAPQTQMLSYNAETAAGVSRNGFMDKTEEAIEEELLRRKNAEISSQLRALDTVNAFKKIVQLLAEIWR